MQIQLKQTEIIAALKQYITGQGINLTGKDVSISFTAGRKESGITADLVIEDTSIPGFDDAPEDSTKPVLVVVPSETPVHAVEEPPEEGKATDESAAAKPPTSLFN